MKAKFLISLMTFFFLMSCTKDKEEPTVDSGIKGKWELLTRTYHVIRDGNPVDVLEDYADEPIKEYRVFHDENKGEFIEGNDVEKFVYLIEGNKLKTKVEGEQNYYTEMFTLEKDNLTIADDPSTDKSEKTTEVYKKVK